MAVDLSAYKRPSWLTAAATGAGYLLILALLFLVLFVVPTLLFTVL